MPAQPRAILLGRGTTLSQAARCTVYLTDLAAFSDVKAVYERVASARVAFGVAALPRGARVEIDAVVAL